MITLITKNETYNEDLINYYTAAIDKHFIHNYYHYCEINKKKTINYTIDDRIVIVIYKIINLDLIVMKSF